MVEFGLFLGFHPAKTWPLVQSSDTRNTYFRILSSLHHSWSSLPFKKSNETGLLSVWNIFICTWFFYILYNSLFLAITAFDVIEALALSLSASLQLLLQGLDVVDGVEDHLKLGHPAGGLLLPVVGRPALWEHWAKPLQLVGGEILGGADVLHHLLNHCHLWLSLGVSGFQKKLCRDVYSSKDEQQVASEARPRSLYSSREGGKEVQVGAVGARGRLELGSRERCRAESSVDYHKTNYFHHPTILRRRPSNYVKRAHTMVSGWRSGELFCTKYLGESCTVVKEELHNGQWSEHTGRAHTLLSSLQIPRVCVYQFSITIQL